MNKWHRILDRMKASSRELQISFTLKVFLINSISHTAQQRLENGSWMRYQSNALKNKTSNLASLRKILNVPIIEINFPGFASNLSQYEARVWLSFSSFKLVFFQTRNKLKKRTFLEVKAYTNTLLLRTLQFLNAM